MREKGVKILVCEDDEFALSLITEMVSLRYDQAAVYSAQNGADGLDLFRAHRPDVVVTDVQMPVMDGVEMCREIQKLAPSVKIVVMTAFGKDSVSELAPAHRHLMKPLVYRDLFQTLDECLAPPQQ